MLSGIYEYKGNWVQNVAYDPNSTLKFDFYSLLSQPWS